MSKPLLDLSYLNALAGNDPGYMYEVLVLFLDTVSDGMTNLEHLVRNTDDYDAIRKQAHSLKSTTSIVNVRDMHEDVKEIENIAKTGSGKAEITQHLDNMIANFREALPHIVAEKDKNSQGG